MKISYSRSGSYLRCPYKHYLAYIKGLKLKKPIKPLSFGSDFHKLLEHRANPIALDQVKEEIGEKYYELPARWQQDLGDDYLMNLSVILDDYQAIYRDSPLPKVTEQPFEIDLGKIKGEPVIFVGVIDELYKYKSRLGERYIKIGEHKTFNMRPNMDTLVMNTQKCLYAEAAYILYGILPRSVIWDYIHSTPAAYPIWLEKTGRFSNAKSTKITPYSWRRACQLQGIKDKNIIREGSKYSQNIGNFFFRYDMDVIPSMVDSIWEGFLYTCRQIVLQGHKNRTKNISRDCPYCNFHDICYTELTGGNVKAIIRKDYIVEPRDDVQTNIQEGE